MRVFILILIFFNSIPLICQTVFLPNIGTSWNYLFRYDRTGEERNTKITYIADSIDPGGEKIKILTSDKFYYVNNYPGISTKVFIKQRNDSVLIWHKNWPIWQVLINYNATVGQTWDFDFNTYPSGHTVMYIAKVLAITTETINNIPLKKMDVKYIGANIAGPLFPTYTCSIYERFGSINFLFPFFNFKDLNYPHPFNPYSDSVSSILCYQDNSFGLKQFTSKLCDYYNLVGYAESEFSKAILKIYPNPASDFLLVEQSSNSDELDLSLVNVLGKEVRRTRFKDKTKLDLRDLNAGIYFVGLWHEGKLIETKKIVKE